MQPPPPEPEPVVVVEKKKEYDSDGNSIQGDDDDAPADDDDEPKKKKKPEPVRPVAPKLVGAPVPSIKDRMIEIKTKLLIQSSSTMLCISNYTEKITLICNVDLKTRRRTL